MKKIRILRCSLLTSSLLFAILPLLVLIKAEWVRTLCECCSVFSMFISVIELIDAFIDVISPERSEQLDRVVREIDSFIDETKLKVINTKEVIDSLDEALQVKCRKIIKRLHEKAEKDLLFLRRIQRNNNGEERQTYDMEKRRIELTKFALPVLAIGVILSAFHGMGFPIYTDGIVFVSLAIFSFSCWMKLLETEDVAKIMQYVQTRKPKKCIRNCNRALNYIKSVSQKTK